MRKYLHSSCISLCIVIIASGCGSRADRLMAEVTETLDSLQSVHAPDTRIALWNLTLSESSGTIDLSGELGNRAALTAIHEAMGERYPEVNVSLILLPEGEHSRLVNGLINNSVAHLRSNPSHMADIVTQSLLGTPIRILKQEGEWFLVQTPNLHLGWVDEAAIQQMDGPALEAYKASEIIVFNRQYGFSYEEPDRNSNPVSDLVIGCLLRVTSSVPGFLNIQYPDGRMAWVSSEETIPASKLVGMDMDDAKLVESALRYMGIPYLWGGTSSKGIDCSGFTSMIYYMNGTLLRRDASQQTHQGKEITTSYDHVNLEPGDLLFYGRPASDSLPERVTHVAMYIGDTEFIHSSGKVKINSMDSTRENYLPEYVPRFVRAVRIKGQTGVNGIQRIADNDFYQEILTMPQ